MADRPAPDESEATAKLSRTRPAVALAIGASLAAALVAASPASATRPGSGTTTGTGSVFMVNPVQSSGNQSLTDAEDSAGAVPLSVCAKVPLRHLDGSGYLVGSWANVRGNTGPAAYSTTNTFSYLRDDNRFEQVMAHFWVNQAQGYLQSLGFGRTLRPVNMESQDVRIDQYGRQLLLDRQEGLPAVRQGRGRRRGGRRGDRARVRPRGARRPGARLRHERGGRLAGESHFDGQIWSRALWEVRQAYPGLGFSTADWDRTLVDSQFDYAPDTSFSAAAKATYAKALTNRGSTAAKLVRARFAARGITFGPAVPLGVEVASSRC